MHWTDDAIVLSNRRHGETGAVVSLFTRAHGRHGGLVRGGAGKRLKGVLQPGNAVLASWRARLAEHLGTCSVELKTARAAEAFDDPPRLAAISAACALIEATLPTHEPHPQLYDACLVLLQAVGESEPDWPAIYVRWELGLLAELGFGLDLSQCAATGATTGLTHVSPKSGRAVSAAAASPYREKLLRLPAFLAGGLGGPPANDTEQDIRDGLALTGFFLERFVLQPHQQKMPAARARLVERMARLRQASGVNSPP